VAIPLITLVAFALLPLVFRSDESSFPTRDTSLALPLLKSFPYHGSPARMAAILGKEDQHSGNDSFYYMDDHSWIRVRMVDGAVWSIACREPPVVDYKFIAFFDID
jgi:hypothetical protein